MCVKYNHTSKGRKGRLPLRATAEQNHTHTRTHPDTHISRQPLIIGNCNYNGFWWLLKLLIITTNNYNMPNQPWGGSLRAITLPVSQRGGCCSQHELRDSLSNSESACSSLSEPVHSWTQAGLCAGSDKVLTSNDHMICGDFLGVPVGAPMEWSFGQNTWLDYGILLGVCSRW